MAGLIVTPKEVYNVAHEVQLSSGFKVDGYFFRDPEGQEPPPPEPDPAMEKIKQDEQSDQRRHLLEAKKLELDGLRIEQDGVIRRYQADLQAATERDKIVSDERIAEMKIRADIEKAHIAAQAAEDKADAAERAQTAKTRGPRHDTRRRRR